MLKRIFCFVSPNNISLFFIGLMFLLPFVIMHHSLPIPLFYSDWIAGTLGFLALLPLLHTRLWQAALSQTIKIPEISLIFPGLALILVAQWTLGMLHSTQYMLLVLSYFIWAFLLVVLSSHLRQELGWGKLVNTLAWGLVIGGIINTVIVVLQLVTRTGGSIPWLPDLISYGAISQTNHFADFTALATASLIYLYVKGRLSLSLFTLMFVCFLIMLSFSGSRSAWLYLSAFTILTVFLQRNSIKQGTDSKSRHSLFRVSLLLLPAFILVQLFVYYILPNELVTLPTKRLMDAAIADTPSARLHIWYDSLRLFMKSPWLGTGAGTMRAESLLLIDTPSAMGLMRVFEHAHNLFLHLLAEMGIGAFLIVITGLWRWIHAFKWPQLSLETWWLVALLAVLGIHSMLEYPLWFAYFLGITAVLLGAGDEKFISISLPKIAVKLGHRFTNKFAYAGLVSVLLFGLVNLSTLLIANIKLENWVQKFRYESVNEQAQLDWVRYYSVLSPYADLLNTMSMTVDPSNIDEQVLLSQSVMRFIPFQKIPYQHVLLLQLQGDHINAVKQLNRILIAYPTDVKAILGYVPLKYRQSYLELLYEVQPKLRNSTDNINAN